MANDELYTPAWIFNALGLQFDLDVASSNSDQVIVPANRRFTIEHDALAKQWNGRVWMNPPFSKPAPWVEKWLAHANGIALLPLSGNSRWWRALWESDAAVAMIKPNTGFTNPAGKEQKIMYGISLWALGQENKEAVSRISKVR